jgi:uncharacterized protein
VTDAPATPPRHSRELAWRLFVRELTASALQERGSGEKAPTHVLTPLGARVNRLLIVGDLAQIEPRGSPEAPLWRARLSDPTGGVTVTAGAYQPRALAFLSELPGPTRVLLVGRPHLFTGRDGTELVSVRADEIVQASEGEERAWAAETARLTLERVRLQERLGGGDAGADARELQGEGFSRPFVESALATRGRYPQVDLAAYRREAEAVLARVAVEARAATG